jgi:DNA (cytosine-5)-methyltransferase 1
MNELALYAGCGGGILGGSILGWRTVCAVEIDRYCAAVLLNRQRDGALPVFPIWDDVRSFDGIPWRGAVDIVSGGVPCQPFSVAGKRKANTDERDMWPETIRIIREVRPRYAFLENVPGLLSIRERFLIVILEKISQLELFSETTSKPFAGKYLRRIFKAFGRYYFGRILGMLAEIGYDAEWCVLGADDAGANHHRKRIWILCHTNDYGQPPSEKQESFTKRNDIGETGKIKTSKSEGSDIECGELAPDSQGERLEERSLYMRHGRSLETEADALGDSEDVSDASGLGKVERRDERFRETESTEGIRSNQRTRKTQYECGEWWETEPDVGRVANGVPSRVDRLKALGNAQVPLTAAVAFTLLFRRMAEHHESDVQRNC